MNIKEITEEIIEYNNKKYIIKRDQYELIEIFNERVSYIKKYIDIYEIEDLEIMSRMYINKKIYNVNY